ncbi:OmpA family protein [Abyssalbus ytuae]|uniref:OmpA family protein n=1 Tax=Abyssalbus ytuae TaxID=2926907 RepID=A0A9E6ZQT2_9FLAO|nr:OmpA family protein [Abyssalbus ytuae]UOB16198.1 OmpA family protein [Abyssalbus ytuae]
MMRNIFSGIIVLLLTSSCISTKVFNDLKADYDTMKMERDRLVEEKGELQSANNKLKNDLSSLQEAYDKAVAERDRLRQDYEAVSNNLKNLQASYNALEKNSNSAIAENVKANRNLLSQLEEKEKALAAERARLNELQRQLDARSRRVDELENVIAAKDASMKQLKDAISKALLDFEGKGLTVEQRDGKVYVSMENKLLFESGSWAVGSEGRRAVEQLGNVLAQNPDIAILIEGHTDNVPYRGNDHISGNWDLSTKRATAIVKILMENKNIKPDNLTAAGRGEYIPVAPNDTAEGKAKNRRIEVILTPKLDEITKLLSEI